MSLCVGFLKIRYWRIMKVLSNLTVNSRGAILRFPQEGEYELVIRLMKGSMRVNHMSFFNVELGFVSPPRGQPAHYDLMEAGTHSLVLTIGQSSGRVDQISLVNPRWKQKASFHYQVLRLEGKT